MVKTTFLKLRAPCKIREWMSCKATFLLFLARMRCIVALRIEILDENRGNVVQQIAAHEFCKRLLSVLLIIVFLTSCQIPPKKHSTPIYHGDQGSVQKSKPAVWRLQQRALAANNEGKFQQSVSLLQRAINIEPRDPWSWHYLAQSYWHLKQYTQCQQMVERSISYAALNHPLEKANSILFKQCSASA